MENASKALIIAGSILISLMVIAVGIYLFRSGMTVTEATTSELNETVIAAFNAKFSIYETPSTFNLGASTLGGTDYGYYTASSELNTIYDVVSAINLAYSVNDENNYSYKYLDTYGLETSNAVEIIIGFGAGWNTLDVDYVWYFLEPSKDAKEGYVYGRSSTYDTRSSRISNFSASDSNALSCNELLEKFSTSKLVSYNNQNYTIYEYYFLGSYETDSITGQINSVKFTICYSPSIYDSL